ncbi:hypothetical protein GCM10028861_20040 [Flavobacterium koreense]
MFVCGGYIQVIGNVKKIVIMRNLFFCFLSIIISSCLNSNKNLESNERDIKQISVNKNQFFEFIEKNPKCSFYFEKYEFKNRHDYLIVKIIGDSSNIIGTFRVITNGSTLNKLIETKGMGYRGAKLLNFKYEILGEELVCVNVEEIID